MGKRHPFPVPGTLGTAWLLTSGEGAEGMAPWESGQPWEPSGYRLGAAGREPLPGLLSLGWGSLFQGLAQPVERLPALGWHLCPCLPAPPAAHP